MRSESKPTPSASAIDTQTPLDSLDEESRPGPMALDLESFTDVPFTNTQQTATVAVGESGGDTLGTVSKSNWHNDARE